ncbi:MAG TPA: hypothetical protein VGF94_24905 [Kofleriaceae bacterium]|jgi:hypothetical protein
MRASFFLLAFAACGDTHLDVPAHCNPLGFGDHCAVPWPSSVFEVDDATTMTGHKLAIFDDTLPKNYQDVAVDPTGWNIADGFSPAAPMLVAFPGGVSVDGLATVDHPEASLAADSPTIVLDMDTGARVPHTAELDAQATGMPDSQALFIRPVVRLVAGHHYAVAITTRVKAADGGDLPVPAGFAALLSGDKTDHALLEAMRPKFPAILDALATAGVAKTDLVLAWDFTVASDDFLHREMIAARDRALAAVVDPVTFTIATDQQPDPNNANIARYITGKLHVPLFLNTPSFGVEDTTVVDDAQGLPVVQGFYDVPFAAIVPACAYTSPTPVPMIMYGHGLLGDSTEVDCCGVPPVAVDLCAVIAGTDLRGMSQQDTGAVAIALNDASKAGGVFEVLEQGLANYIVLAHSMRTSLATQLFVDASNGNKSLVDPTQLYYLGMSQGAIFGASTMAYEPTITRAVLTSGAANYSFLLDRSGDWPQYRSILNAAYTDPLDDELVINLMQMRWDKTEPAGIANSVLDGTATGVPPKQLLLQIAVADNEVSDYAAYWEARALGVQVLSTTVASPWGLDMTAAPTGSALAIYDCAGPAIPITNTPPPQQGCTMAGTSELHDLPAHVAAGRRQMKDFYTTGQIVDECAGGGDCTCATGACN